MRKILIAEDEPAINKMLCMNLGLMGYDTAAKFDGQQVLDYLADGGSADLALVDVMMPRVDGFRLLEPLKEQGGKDRLRANHHYLRQPGFRPAPVLRPKYRRAACGGHLFLRPLSGG